MRNTMVQARIFATYPRLSVARLTASVECKAANMAASCKETNDNPASLSDAHFTAREGAANLALFGVDPDVSGAVAILRRGGNEMFAQVIDVPSVYVAVGKTTRRRHDARSLVAILNQLEAPQGSVAYIEESRPFPKDGKLGWYSTGLGYGIWTGVLVALGFSVVPVRSQAWKAAMGLAGTQYTKDDSRALACSLFPSLAPQLKRKKDHGRAEALLIAAFGTSFQWNDNGLVPPKSS